MYKITNLSFSFVIFIYFATVYTHPQTPSCGLYGLPPCQFVPAPPGHTPSCARPGSTYCEFIDNYPIYIIKRLIHKWGYESKNLIVDETWEDFKSSSIHFHHINHRHYYDHTGILTSFNNLGYNYDNPNDNNRKNQNNNNNNNDGNKFTTDTFFLPKSIKDSKFTIFNNNGGNGQQQSQLSFVPKVTQYNPSVWLKRYVRDLDEQQIKLPTTPVFENLKVGVVNVKNENFNQNSRDVSINMSHKDIFGLKEMNKNQKNMRNKRQSAGRSTLCETTSSFVQPQAALNSKGNWMYVVNEPNTARQLVKAERCVSTQCSNICSLPNGYNSRCEQKFVQKRLIALNSNGQNLYTDSFWFPSCCVCTISDF